MLALESRGLLSQIGILRSAQTQLACFVLKLGAEPCCDLSQLRSIVPQPFNCKLLGCGMVRLPDLRAPAPDLLDQADRPRHASE